MFIDIFCCSDLLGSFVFMKFVDGVEVVEVCDIRGVLDCCDCVSVYVFDVECGCFDFVTGVYVDGDGDLILEIGGEG